MAATATHFVPLAGNAWTSSAATPFTIPSFTYSSLSAAAVPSSEEMGAFTATVETTVAAALSAERAAMAQLSTDAAERFTAMERALTEVTAAATTQRGAAQNAIASLTAQNSGQASVIVELQATVAQLRSIIETAYPVPAAAVEASDVFKTVQGQLHESRARLTVAQEENVLLQARVDALLQSLAAAKVTAAPAGPATTAGAVAAYAALSGISMQRQGTASAVPSSILGMYACSTQHLDGTRVEFSLEFMRADDGSEGTCVEFTPGLNAEAMLPPFLHGAIRFEVSQAPMFVAKIIEAMRSVDDGEEESTAAVPVDAMLTSPIAPASTVSVDIDMRMEGASMTPAPLAAIGSVSARTRSRARASMRISSEGLMFTRSPKALLATAGRQEVDAAVMTATPSRARARATRLQGSARRAVAIMDACVDTVDDAHEAPAAGLNAAAGM